MKIRCWSKPGIYLVVLHNNSDKEPTTTIVCFRFSGRLKSQHALKVSRTSWGYTVVELKHITKKSTNQSRVHVREPKCDWPSKDCRMIPGHSSPPLSRPAIFLSVCAFFLLECPSRVSFNVLQDKLNLANIKNNSIYQPLIYTAGGLQTAEDSV